MFILAAMLAGHVYVMSVNEGGERVPVLIPTLKQCREAMAKMKPTLPASAEWECVDADGAELDLEEPPAKPIGDLKSNA